MVRANGDALVMHVGEKPIVVAGSKTIDLSTHGLNLGAMIGMLRQLLPADAQASLAEFGAVEHGLPSRGTDRFTVVAARGGDDIWIEIRRRRDKAAEPADDVPEPTEPADAVSAQADAPPLEDARADAVSSTSGSAPEPAGEPVRVAAVEEPVPAARAEAAQQAEAAPDAEAAHEPDTAPAMAEARQEAADTTIDDGEAAIAMTDVPVLVEVEVADAAVETTHESPAVVSESAHADAADEEGAQEPEATAVEPATAPAPAPIAVAPAEEVDDQPAEAPAAEHEPVLVAEAGASQGEAALVADAPVEAMAAQETAEVRASEPVPVMAAAGASGHPDMQMSTPMTPMDSTPPPVGPAPSSVAAISPSASTAPSGGVTSGGSEPPATPVTRTVRIEVPSRAAGARSSTTDRLLRAASGQAASELFLISQARPYIRVDGEIRVLEEETPLQAADVEAMLADVTPEPWRDAVRRGDPAEWLMEFADVGRVRCATFRDHRGPGAIFHFSSTHAATADQLGLDPTARLLATEPDGLVVVAGPSGSDKSAIVAAFVDIINRNRADYVITLEPQVRVSHEPHQALVSQREVGTEVDRSVAMARAALRENPDVLVLEDVAAGELVSLALDAANDGRLVVVSLEVGSAADAVQRLIELVPAERRSAARLAMAQSFRGAVAQLLLRKSTGGRIAAREVLAGTGAVTRLIAEGNLPELSATIEAGCNAGMAPMVDALVGYVRSGVVDVREAVRRAPDRARLMAALKAAGVDTTTVMS